MKIINLLFFTFLLTVSCTTDPILDENHPEVSYYIDATNGNDNNSGTSPDSAWQTLNKINRVPIYAGGKILLKRGENFSGTLEITGKGFPEKRILIDAYGEGEIKPRITAPDASLYAIRIYNSDYVTVKNIEVINTGSRRLPFRTGVKISCANYGISHNIILDSLYIHDVNGSLVKSEGGGSGIYIERKNTGAVSLYDNLIIQNCIIRRCERNAIIWSEGKDNNINRTNWHPNTHTVIRNNLIEEVPGDGIVPIGCDGTIIEYNVMKNCPETLPETEAAAGFWPWSCDNTIIQFNEVSDHKAPWDAQGYDADYNCTGTIIQYNYSHNNYGGMALVCNSGDSKYPGNIGNKRTILRYNISINDGLRPKPARNKMFSPSIHIAGPVMNTVIEHNIIYQGKKPSPEIDRTMIVSDSWGGYADSTAFRENIFFAQEESCFLMNKSTRNFFENNFYFGKFTQIPESINAISLTDFQRELKDSFDQDGAARLTLLMEKKQIGETTADFVNKAAIENFFKEMTGK